MCIVRSPEADNLQHQSVRWHTVRADTAGAETIPVHGLRVSAPVLQFSAPIAQRATD